MIITKEHLGAHGRKIYYVLRNSITDTGTGRPDELARFETLETAALVKRYIDGCEMSEADEYHAKKAIKKAEAPTD